VSVYYNHSNLMSITMSMKFVDDRKEGETPEDYKERILCDAKIRFLNNLILNMSKQTTSKITHIKLCSGENITVDQYKERLWDKTKKSFVGDTQLTVLLDDKNLNYLTQPVSKIKQLWNYIEQITM
jgi:hydroxyacyl-ACP dehydratase HTD2-like protein with hotdog domain